MIGWDNGADIDPDDVYNDMKPAWMEETKKNIAMYIRSSKKAIHIRTALFASYELDHDIDITTGAGVLESELSYL